MRCSFAGRQGTAPPTRKESRSKTHALRPGNGSRLSGAWMRRSYPRRRKAIVRTTGSSPAWCSENTHCEPAPVTSQSPSTASPRHTSLRLHGSQCQLAFSAPLHCRRPSSVAEAAGGSQAFVLPPQPVPARFFLAFESCARKTKQSRSFCSWVHRRALPQTGVDLSWVAIGPSGLGRSTAYGSRPAGRSAPRSKRSTARNPSDLWPRQPPRADSQAEEALPSRP
mmetsp:Transcript_58915/g.138076  ORF Transcript_58915/g.138076 Transcript_58915/m.138076 type:complete len:224 (-) Transcript_58915:39-710(-)